MQTSNASIGDWDNGIHANTFPVPDNDQKHAIISPSYFSAFKAAAAAVDSIYFSLFSLSFDLSLKKLPDNETKYFDSYCAVGNAKETQYLILSSWNFSRYFFLCVIVS